MSSDLHVLTGAYASGALLAEERVAFEEHLESCAQCAQEVRELVETAALLGVAAAEPPPPGLRQRVFAEVARTRQLPPLVTPADELADRRARRGGADRSRRWSLTAAACLAVFTIGLGAYTTQLHQQNADLRADNAHVTALQRPDVRTVTGSGAGATAAVTVSRQADELMFLSHGLADLKDDRIYQLWVMGDEGPRSAGTFAPGHEPRFVPGIQDATAVAVTEEPAGGSPQPTSDPILTLALPKT